MILQSNWMLSVRVLYGRPEALVEFRNRFREIWEIDHRTDTDKPCLGANAQKTGSMK